MNTLLTSSRHEKLMKFAKFAMMAVMLCMLCMLCVNMPFAAAKAAGEIKGVLTEMINIVGTIFQAVGVVLSVYSVGQLVLAFKNEDADSKSRASTMLVVGVCLIAMPTIISELKLVDKIK